MDAETRQKELPFREQEMALKHRDLQAEDQNRDEDRKSRERVALLGLAKDVLVHHTKLDSEHELQDKDHDHERGQQDQEHSQERFIQAHEPKPAAPSSEKK